MDTRRPQTKGFDVERETIARNEDALTKAFIMTLSVQCNHAGGASAQSKASWKTKSKAGFIPIGRRWVTSKMVGAAMPEREVKIAVKPWL
jgi:hypothetical protein